jgi:MFS family permease
MPESPYEVLALFTGAMVGSSLFIMGTGALMTFFGSALHLGQAQLGSILSVQLTGSVAMTSLAGILTDRFGDKAVVFWSGMLMGFALIAAALFQNFAWLVAWLLMYSVGYAAVTPSGCHAIIFFFKKAQRGLAMGVRQCGVPLAGVIASILLPAIASHVGYRGALLAAGVLTLIACWVASALYREPCELQGERASIGEMLAEMLAISREPQLILLTIASMILICSQFVLMAFLTLTLVHRAGYALPVAVGIFTISQLAAIAGRLMWGWVSDHVFGGSRTLPLAVVAVLVALFALAIASIDPTTPHWLAALIAIGFGFTAEGWLGVAVIGFAEIGGEEHSGSALGVGLTWSLLAAALAPPIFGALVEAQSYEVAWRWLAVLSISAVIPALAASSVVVGIFRREPIA